MYGATEASPRMSYLPWENIEKTQSIGKAIPGGEFYLEDSNRKVIKEINTHGELIYKGKIMYLMSQFLPHKNIETILRFSKSEFEECEESESVIWDGIISLDLLYSNYEREYHSFFNIDVCTRPISPDSPSRLGYYTGYKIIQNYMQNTDVSLLELMQNTNSQQILLNSKYNPKHD